MHTSKYWIEKLDLLPHPEGGWYKETYRSEGKIPQSVLPAGFSGDRVYSSAIYYLLDHHNFSAFHKINSDETWHYYTGNSAIEIISIEHNKLVKQLLGDQLKNGESFQVTVPANCWFAARLVYSSGFALAGCTVAPGFNFDDFVLADEKLLDEYPEFKSEIKPLIR